PPSLDWTVYSTLNLAKFSVTFSVRRSSPPEPPVCTADTSTSVSVILMYSRGRSPALRTVSLASLMCVPLHAATIRAVELESTHLVSEISCTLTLPAPAPVPAWAVPDWLRPQLQASTSISSACLSSYDSLLISPILMNMSTAMMLLHPVRQPAENRNRQKKVWGRGQAPAPPAYGVGP